LTYPLEQLGPGGFQDLTAALAIASFGPGIQSMGAGRDGGRDLLFHGRLAWTGAEPHVGEVWDGYTVFQSKHKAILASKPSENARWLWDQIRIELLSWADPASDRGAMPDFLVFVSNVPLTPTPGSGGYDVIEAKIRGLISSFDDSSRDIGSKDREARRSRQKRLSKLQKWRIWDSNQITALLNAKPDVRAGFPAFFTAADVFANLGAFTDRLPLDELGPALNMHARSALMSDGLIYFDEAGSGDAKGISVHEVAVDLPMTVDGLGAPGSVINHVLDRAERVLRPKLTTHKAPRHLIIAGAPGNGKTTISKFFVQIFRAAILEGATELSEDHRQLINGTREALKRFHRVLPKHRRWPIRIDLGEYVDEGGLNEDSTLLRWIAYKISKRSNRGAITAPALESWMDQWPWLVVIDGLDEVTEPTIRKRLIAQVTTFVNDAEGDNRDVLVVLTTRPLGYTEDIAPTQFQRVDLADLGVEEAVLYGNQVTRVRLGNDVDRIERVARGLEAASTDISLRNLLRTPLQVLILTIIVDGAGQLSPDRYSLFWQYFDTVFKRERNKLGELHRVLQEHGQQIQQLHERFGFELHVKSESGNHPTPTLNASELREIIWCVLCEAGYNPATQHAELLEDIFRIATTRLVLITKRANNEYGFDVRSLQELMAARYLTTGSLQSVVERLRVAAPSVHWRNPWIFAAGRYFAEPQSYQHEAVVELVETIDRDSDHRLGSILPIGPRLGLDLIDDGMTRHIPRWRDRILRHSLLVFEQPSGTDMKYIVRTLVSYADTGDDQRRQVAAGLEYAMRSSTTSRKSVQAAIKLIPDAAAAVSAGGQILALSKIHAGQAKRKAQPFTQAWEEFDTEVETTPLVGLAATLFARATAAIRSIAGRGPAIDAEAETLIAGLANPQSARAIVVALEQLVLADPKLFVVLRDETLGSLFRAPIGEKLRAPATARSLCR
jgi:hypothetical protein